MAIWAHEPDSGKQARRVWCGVPPSLGLSDAISHQHTGLELWQGALLVTKCQGC